MTQEPQFRENSREKYWHNNHDEALKRLIHDVGFEIAGELVNGKPRVVDAVVSQMSSGVKPYELDFKALGVSDEQVVRIKAHQEVRRALEEETKQATSHLIQGAGIDVATELMDNPKAVEGLLTQFRAGAKPNEIDFAALGASPEQLERISHHQAARRALEEAARGNHVETAEGFAQRPGADEDLRDTGPRVQPRPPVQPVGRVNTDGPSIAKGA